MIEASESESAGAKDPETWWWSEGAGRDGLGEGAGRLEAPEIGGA